MTAAANAGDAVMPDPPADIVAAMDQAMALIRDSAQGLVDSAEGESVVDVWMYAFGCDLLRRTDADRDKLIELVAAATMLVAQRMETDQQSRQWALPPEPGPEVLRLRPVERYPGDNSLWLDRDRARQGWRIVMRGRAGMSLEWVQAFGFGMAEVFGGRPLLDATAEVPADASAATEGAA